MTILTTLLAQTGWGLLGWAAGKGCGAGMRTAHNALLDRLRAGKLDPNHDIERAILRAHYRALEFLVREAVENQGFDESAAGVLNGRAFLKKRLKQVESNKIKTLAGYLSADWKGLIPATFEGQDTRLPENHVDAAIAELLAVQGWDEHEKKTLREMAHDNHTGWVTAFSAHIREQLKTNKEFRAIYTAEVLEGQTGKLDQILAALPVLDDIKKTVDVIDARTKRMEATLGQMIRKGHYTNEVGHNYPKYLMRKMFELNIPEERWEPEITRALKRYSAGKAQLAQQTNLPAHMEARRKLALELFEQAKMDEGEAVLVELQNHADEAFESAARDRAKILIDRVPFAQARFDFTAAIELYQQAANTVLALDPGQAVNWFRLGGIIGYERYQLSGEPVFSAHAVRLYQAALALVSNADGRAKTGQEKTWAMTQNNLGNIYGVLGERGDDEALAKAVTAYENALKEYTREKAPMQWAMTQNNLGTVYEVLGQRGDDEALAKAVTAYKNTLKEHTREKAPMDWAMTQNNLGIVYRVLGQRGDDEALAKAVKAYENALEEYTREKAPMQWATTQNNLGAVYRVLGQRGNDEALGKAVTAYENALKEHTREKAPMDWAMTTANLGYVLRFNNDKQAGEACLRAALAYFRTVDVPYYINQLESMMGDVGLEP